MVSQVKMPKSSLTMQEGTILKWHKGEGEKIEKGEPLVQIMEEKSTIDLESPTSGYVRKVYFKEQEDVPVGKIIAVIGDKDEPFPSIDEEPKIDRLEEEPPKPIHKDVEEPIPISREIEESKLVSHELKEPGKIRASPLAKKIARQRGIELSKIKGTGFEGRITAKDVEALISEDTKKVKDIIPLTGMRKIIAQKMSLSARTYSRITLIVEVDASEMKSFRERLKLFETLDISYNDIIVKATAMALAKHSILNSTLTGDEIKVFEDVNVGVAVASPLGLVVPVVHKADSLSLTEISKQTKRLIENAKNGTLSKEEISEGTFTITNLGMFGVDVFTPIINPPETAILGVAAIKERPIVENGRIKVKPTVYLSLSVDHRVVDGAPAAAFLQTLKNILEKVKLVED